MRVGGELAGDQAEDDALSVCFDTPPLEAPLELLGRAEAEIAFTADRPAAQLCLRLCDVAPRGVSQRITYRAFNLAHDSGHGVAMPLRPHRVRRVCTALNHCAHRLRCNGRTDDMLIVRGVNVWPSAVKDVVTGFRPDVSGEVPISVEGPGPQVDPPLRITVELGGGGGGGPQGLAARMEQALRAKVELVPRGVLPRTPMKAKLVERNAG